MDHNVLWTFMSPQTGRILCDTDHVLVGDANGVAIPSLYIPGGALPDLEYQYIWIGDASNRPQPQKTITIDNLPDLHATVAGVPPRVRGHVWVGGNGPLLNRPEESDVNNLKISLDPDTDITLQALGLAAFGIDGSVLPSKPYGNIYVSENATVTPILLADVFYKVQCISLDASNALFRFLNSGDGRLTYFPPLTEPIALTSTIDTIVTVNISAVFSGGAGAQTVIGVSIFKNGTEQISPTMYQGVDTTSAYSVANISLTTYVRLESTPPVITNCDYLEVFVTCAETGNMTVQNMSFTVEALGGI